MPEEIFILDKKVRLLQPEGGFRTSLDSVMVAAACPAKAGDTVLDLGCGVGGASFSLGYRVNNLFITGIDIQPEYIDLAQQNILLNNDTNRFEFFVGDIGTFRFPSMNQRVAQVLCNPPFLGAGTYTPSPDTGRATALGHEGQETELTDWIDCAFHALKNNGTLTMIHRADHLDKIVQCLGKRFGQTEIIPLYPREGQPAKRVIVRTRKDSHAPSILHAGLTLHNADGSYTDAAERILRNGEGLNLAASP